jgi:hypothetical protein
MTAAQIHEANSVVGAMWVGLGASLLWHVVEPLNYVMEREMLRGIKRRAEATHRG